MTDTERDLRKAINELLHIARMNDFMKKANSELNALLDGSDYAVQMLEHKADAEKYRQARDYFSELLEKVKSSYGSSAVVGAYNCFKAALDNDEFRHEIGAAEELSLQEKGNIFRASFDRIISKAEEWDYEQDFYSYFIETVKEYFMTTEEVNTEPEELCPYCDGMPIRISKADFFGPYSAAGDGYVWGCECGAYAEMTDDGKIVGKLGDAILHQKRTLVRGAICELCSLAGLTVFESLRWFSFVTGLKITALSDVEYLETKSCNMAIHLFLQKKQELQKTLFQYPKDRSELFLFFCDGGRLVVCNAYGFQSGKLLVPSEIGTEGIRIFGKESSISIGLSDSLQYEFKDDILYIRHPSGRKEKFRMLPAKMRELLFEIKENQTATVKVG